MSILDAAILYATDPDHLWSVFPIKPLLKRPRIRTGKDHAVGASRDPKQLKEWFDIEYPYDLLGMPTGIINNVVVIDCDAKHDGEHLVNILENLYGKLPRDCVVRTPGGGIHIYLQHPGAHVRILSCVGGDSAPWSSRGVDVRGDGGIILLPPSAGYVWLQPGDIPPMPQRWVDVLTVKKRAALEPVEVAPVEYTGVYSDEHFEKLSDLRRKYRTSGRQGDDVRAGLIDRILTKRSLAGIGGRDSAVTRAGFIIGLALPEIGPEAAVHLAGWSLAAMPKTDDGEDGEHFTEKFSRSYVKGSLTRRENDERNRLQWLALSKSLAARRQV